MIKTKFWIFSALVLLVVGANFYYTAVRLHSTVTADVEDRLGWGEARIGGVEAAEARTPVETVRMVASLPRLGEELEAAGEIESPPDSATFERVSILLGEAASGTETVPHRRLMVSTVHGTTDLHVERPVDVKIPPPDIPALRSALNGEFGAGLLAENGEILRIVAAPVIFEENVHGAILLGYPLDEAYVRTLSEAIGADVSVVVEGSVIATTLPSELRSTVAMASRRAALGRTFGYGNGGGPIAGIAASVLGTEFFQGYARKIALAGLDDAHTVISVPAGGNFGWVEEYQTYQVAAAGALLLLALIWAFFLATSVNQPVRLMVAQMSRAASGDVKTRLETTKFRGELRRLAELLNGVLDQAERKAPVGVAVGAKKEPDLSSLLPDTPPEHEAHSPEDFDFGFGGKPQHADEQPASAEAAPAQPEEPAPSADEAPSEAPPPSLDPPLEPPAPAGPQVEATPEEDPFAMFGQESQPEPAPEPPPPPPPEPAPREEDPFAAFSGEGSQYQNELDAAAAASAQDYQEEDSTRVVSLGDMEAAAKAAEHGSGAPSPPAPPPAPPAPAVDPFAAAMGDMGDDDDDDGYGPDATVVAKVPQALLQATARAAGGSAAAQQDPDEAHFREVFRSFVTTRQKCGEPADGLTFEKFAVKLRKNRDTIKEKHGAKSVRFQVYVKDGKAALKATPVR